MSATANSHKGTSDESEKASERAVRLGELKTVLGDVLGSEVDNITAEAASFDKDDYAAQDRAIHDGAVSLYQSYLRLPADEDDGADIKFALSYFSDGSLAEDVVRMHHSAIRDVLRQIARDKRAKRVADRAAPSRVPTRATIAAA